LKFSFTKPKSRRIRDEKWFNSFPKPGHVEFCNTLIKAMSLRAALWRSNLQLSAKSTQFWHFPVKMGIASSGKAPSSQRHDPVS
jgi:hypothetical protein